MKIVIGSDHGGFELKSKVKSYLLKNGMEIEDVGCFDTKPVDYPDFGAMVAKKVASGDADRGVAICITGLGMSMMCNRFVGARCALCHEPYSAEMSRKHNDANILALGAGLVGEKMALEILEKWLTTEFEGDRHERRVHKLDHLSGGQKKDPELSEV